jgi:pimeloyl-ACP methyl ester carboxylesterase
MTTGGAAIVEENDGRWLWPEYYQAFPAFSPETVRKGCHPRKLLHPGGADKAIVLVHGLTDSPFYMVAIGAYFHAVLGYNVFLPLLQCHGLRSPAGMAGVSLAEWQKNVRFAIDSAALGARKVSLGGLSTGGALSYFLAHSEAKVTGDIYLFSAALGLAACPCGIPGRLKETLLRLPFIGNMTLGPPLIGRHPYRYEWVSPNSAAELARLIREIDGLPRPFIKPAGVAGRIFAAWSEDDRVISLRRLRELQQRVPDYLFTSFVISGTDRVDHASVVLKDPIYAIGAEAGDRPLESANPRFAEMVAAIASFEAAGDPRPGVSR